MHAKQHVAVLALGVMLALPVFSHAAEPTAAKPATAPAGATAQQIPDSPQARQTAAKEYLKIQPVEQLYQDTVNELAQQVPTEKQTEFKHTMSTAVDMPKLNELAIESLTKNFTATELNYMTSFYGSPTGKAIYNKFPNYLSDIGQGLRQVITFPEDKAVPTTQGSGGTPGATTQKQPATTNTQTTAPKK